jgi:hypothetical protein
MGANMSAASATSRAFRSHERRIRRVSTHPPRVPADRPREAVDGERAVGAAPDVRESATPNHQRSHERHHVQLEIVVAPTAGPDG